MLKNLGEIILFLVFFVALTFEPLLDLIFDYFYF